MKPPRHRHMGVARHPLTATFWEKSYRTGAAYWDHGAPVPGLVDFLEHHPYRPGTVLVPGCGRGHDCRQLAQHGFTVTGLDLSAQALTEARQLTRAAALPVTYRRGDFLKPGRLRYDWVFEHTCFCAINPARRPQYVNALIKVLRPRGRYLAIFYNIRPRTGPPFGTNRTELLERFGPHFRLLHEAVPRSYPNRTGKELLMLWEKLT